VRGDEAIASRATLSPQASPALGFAGLLVEFANSHLFLDAASLDQLPKAPNRFLSRLFVSQRQFDHCFSYNLVSIRPPARPPDHLSGISDSKRCLQ
jgi:hypothetical protein